MRDVARKQGCEDTAPGAESIKGCGRAEIAQNFGVIKQIKNIQKYQQQ